MANDYSLNNGTGNNIYSRSSFNTQVRPATSAPSSALTEGAHFRGQVTNITPNEIHLTTDSGKEIVARYNNNTDLSIGDSAKFVVTSNENGVITIKPDMGSASGGTDPRITNAIIKVLENADLPSTKENVSMIETMLKYNMPVGKEAVNSMIRSLHRFPSADPSAVITMMHNGIPVTSENIAQFTNYANLNGQLTEYMSAVTEEILSLLDNLTASMQGAEGLDKNAVITFLKDIFTQFNAENIDEGLATSYGDEAQFTGVPEILSSENLDAILTGNETTGFKVTESGLPIVTLSGNEEPSDGVLLNDAAIDATDPEELSALAKHLEAETLKDVITPKYNIPISEAEDYLQFLMSKGEYTLFSGNDDPNLSDLASATLQVAGNLEETDLKELFNHPVFKKLLDNLIGKNWTLDLNRPINEKTVKNLYDRIYKGLDKLTESAGKLAGSSESLSNVLNNVKNNVNFMNDLNSVYSYIQLPVSMTNGNKSGELYVFTDKRKIRGKGDNTLSCMLHLDMTYLGRTDVYITLKNDDVTARFKVDDKKSAALISAHINELDKAIDFHGYNLNAKVLKDDEKLSDFDFVNDFIDRELPPVKVQRYTFDVRA